MTFVIAVKCQKLSQICINLSTTTPTPTSRHSIAPVPIFRAKILERSIFTNRMLRGFWPMKILPAQESEFFAQIFNFKLLPLYALRGKKVKANEKTLKYKQAMLSLQRMADECFFSRYYLMIIFLYGCS